MHLCRFVNVIVRPVAATIDRRGAMPLAAALLVLATSLTAVAGPQPSYEAVTALNASELAPAQLLTGPRFKVDERVSMTTLQPRFVIQSDFGVFEAHGRDMLTIRVHEIAALDQLEKTSKTEEFMKAAGGAVARPVKSAANMVTHPVETVTGLPAAAGRFFDRMAVGAKSISKAGDGADSTAAVTQRIGGLTADVLGYEQERRALAKRLNVDPYTTNQVLADRMDEMAWAAFSGRVGLNTAVAIVVPYSLAISATTVTNDLVWDMKPGDLIVTNDKKLKAMGIADGSRAALLQTRWYSLTMLTSLVNGLERLNGVRGREPVVSFAAAAASEERARLIVGAVEMFARYHAEAEPLAQLSAPGPIVARTNRGATLVAAPLDYVAWTEPVASFARRPELAAKERSVWLTGTPTPRARQGLAAAGWAVREGPKAAIVRQQVR